MKKKYITPAMAMVHLNSALMISVVSNDSKTVSDESSVASSRYNGSIWTNGAADEDDGSWF